jgi:hypothetical protein
VHSRAGHRAPAPAAFAHTIVELPAGRYRLIVTSDDGARLFIDADASSMHGAFARPVATRLTFHYKRVGTSWKVKYFQAGGSYKLRVRIEPLDEH